MSTLPRLLGLLLLALQGPALAGDTTDLSAFEAAIRSQYDLREKAFNSGDLQTIVNRFYAEDLISVPPGDEVVLGRQQLLAAYRAHSDMKIHIASYKTHLNGDNGIDWANFYYTPNDPEQPPGVLKMLFLWEKRAGKWVCIGDMFVSGKFPAGDSKVPAAH